MSIVGTTQKTVGLHRSKNVKMGIKALLQGFAGRSRQSVKVNLLAGW